MKEVNQQHEAYYIMQKTPEGEHGRPLGNEDGAMMLFEELEQAKTVRSHLTSTQPEMSGLAIMKVSVTIVGEVVA